MKNADFDLTTNESRYNDMRSYEENLETATRLEQLRSAMKSVYGEQWEEIIAEQRPIIESLMERDGHNNPIKAVIPVAKQMRADGHDPLLVLAVAAELIYRQNDQVEARRK